MAAVTRSPKPSATRQEFCRSPVQPHIEVRTSTASALPYAAHFHPAYSLGLITAGRTLMTCRQGAMPLVRGDMVAIGPGQVHSCNPIAAQPRSYHMFDIDAAWLEERMRPLAPGRPVLAVRRIHDPRAFSALVRLAEALRACGSDADGEEALIRCFVLVCDFVAESAHEDDPAARLLDPTAGDTITTIDAAARLGIRRETLSRSFCRSHGLPPAAYRQCLRLARARRMLADGAAIVDAAIACGFADQSHLHRMCVKYLAATPRQIRAARSHSSKKS